MLSLPVEVCYFSQACNRYVKAFYFVSNLAPVIFCLRPNDDPFCQTGHIVNNLQLIVRANHSTRYYLQKILDSNLQRRL